MIKNKLNETKFILKNWNNFLKEQNSNDNIEITFGDLKSFLKGDIKKTKVKNLLKIIAKISGASALSSGFESIEVLNDFIKDVGGETLEVALESQTGKVKGFIEKLKNSVGKSNKFDVFKKFYGLNGDGGYPGFKIDPKTSKILDDKVEKDFINWLLKKVESESDSKPLDDFNCNDELNIYLKQIADKKITSN